ncbi:MAG: 16S rRNA (cytosine(967)-C(5))-methyltransferase RsmB [Ignavibacteria bacterium]|jgi:16S rRNA (cytosine967-C5)-methyltransferase|nr:16S rRNA (cytosine(967)-C(5))-methyltransferase RsmB [Ignavibacteria bacterium]MCU7502028.1 16S rRNA (cytosine(967)-C(5))-methyltransferase RsmB [Ignavibacteria bacterium]MCU7516996.1 16S rRNA (cytosine(967)-C(5))-methyltransferase RsmB [Ignavibacteria bacterium]
MINEEGQTKADLYAGVRGTAVKVLNRIERTDAYLEKLLEYELKNSELNSQDKALLYEIVHGVCRWSGKIDWILNGFFKGQFSKSVPNVKNTLRVAVYQIMFLNKIPAYAAVNEAVELIKRLQGQKYAGLINAVLRNIIRCKDSIRYPDAREDTALYLSIYYSHPMWMVKRWLARFGLQATEALLIANNERPGLSLRVNTAKTTPEEFKTLLDGVSLKYSPGQYLLEFIKLNSVTNIMDWEYFAKGYFNIQDESTGFSCRLLDVKPSMRVLDLCAAPGGKTTYISNLMQNEGEIVAIDKYESRLKALRKNLERLGITNVKTVEADALKYEDEPFDRVLLDTPCSGLGTLSKKPDIKWKRDLADIRNLNALQLELLEKAASLVKPGGAVVYSTCTIEPDENYEIVKKFLDNNPDFQVHRNNGEVPAELIDENGCLQTLPQVNNIDGAFACRLDRVG